MIKTGQRAPPTNIHTRMDNIQDNVFVLCKIVTTADNISFE